MKKYIPNTYLDLQREIAITKQIQQDMQQAQSVELRRLFDSSTDALSQLQALSEQHKYFALRISTMCSAKDGEALKDFVSQSLKLQEQLLQSVQVLHAEMKDLRTSWARDMKSVNTYRKELESRRSV